MVNNIVVKNRLKLQEYKVQAEGQLQLYYKLKLSVALSNFYHFDNS